MIGLFWIAIIWFIHSQGILAIMPISIMQWRVEIGIFNVRFCIRCKSNALRSLIPLLYTIAGTSVTWRTIFLLLCSDVELNPGPTKKRNSWFNFFICHWNLNSLTAHNFEKVNHLEAYKRSKQIRYNLSIRNFSWFLNSNRKQ